MIRSFAIVCIVASLAACARPVAPDLRSALSRSNIDGSPQPLLLAELPTQALAATLAPAGERDGVVTWRTGQGQTLSFRNGVLIATRGLGDDLMSADVSGTLAALSGGPVSGYPRLMTYLDGEDGTLFRAMTCEMAPPTSSSVSSFDVTFPTMLWTETCYTTGLSVENRYWLNADGTMRRSEQWVGPMLGTLASEWISR